MRSALLLVALTLATAQALALAEPAGAQDTEGCEVMIDPSEEEGGTFVVKEGDVVTVSAEAEGEARPIDLYYLGTRWEIGEAAGGEATIDVDEFARWGVGRYEVVWGENCSVTIDVEGSFFGATAAIVATATLAVGLAALVLSLTLRVRITNPNARWVLKLVGKGRLERDEESGRIRASFSYSVTQTLLGTLLGLALAGASFTMLQQAAVTPPTIEVALEVMLPITLIGVCVGIWRSRVRYDPPPSPGA